MLYSVLIDADIGDGDTYLNPIETMKRTSDQKYLTMMDRKSYIPSQQTLKFDVSFSLRA